MKVSGKTPTLQSFHPKILSPIALQARATHRKEKAAREAEERRAAAAQDAGEKEADFDHAIVRGPGMRTDVRGVFIGVHLYQGCFR